MALLYKNAKKAVDSQFDELSKNYKPVASEDGKSYQWVNKTTGDIYQGKSPIPGRDVEAGAFDNIRNRRQQRLMSEKVTGMLDKPSGKKQDNTAITTPKPGDTKKPGDTPTAQLNTPQGDNENIKPGEYVAKDFSMPTLAPLKSGQVKTGGASTAVVPIEQKEERPSVVPYDAKNPNIYDKYTYMDPSQNYGGKFAAMGIFGGRSDKEIQMQQKHGASMPFNIMGGVASDSDVQYPKKTVIDGVEYKLQLNPDYQPNTYRTRDEAMVASVMPNLFAPGAFGATTPQNRDVVENKSGGFTVKKPLLERATDVAAHYLSPVAEVFAAEGVGKVIGGALGLGKAAAPKVVKAASKLVPKAEEAVAPGGNVVGEATSKFFTKTNSKLPAVWKRTAFGKGTAPSTGVPFSMGSGTVGELPQAASKFALPEYKAGETAMQFVDANGQLIRIARPMPKTPIQLRIPGMKCGGKLKPRNKGKGK